MESSKSRPKCNLIFINIFFVNAVSDQISETNNDLKKKENKERKPEKGLNYKIISSYY